MFAIHYLVLARLDSIVAKAVALRATAAAGYSDVLAWLLKEANAAEVGSLLELMAKYVPSVWGPLLTEETDKYARQCCGRARRTL